MSNGFTKGMVIGSIIGASVGMMMRNDPRQRSRKRMMRTGRILLRRSGDILSNVVDVLR